MILSWDSKYWEFRLVKWELMLVSWDLTGSSDIGISYISWDIYPLVNVYKKQKGTSPCLVGKLSISTGPCSINGHATGTD